MGLACGAWAL
nr:hypothetical protein (ODC region) - human [Homo sapiens]